METKIITKKDLDANNSIEEIVFEGNLEFEEGLGYVVIQKKVSVLGYIFAEAGTGIEAGEGIKAGEGIISFFGGLIAKWVSCLRVAVGFNVTEEKTIKAEIRKGTVILGRIEKN